MSGIGFLGDMGIITLCAAFMVALARKIRMPAIVVYLLCGVLLGPGFGWVKTSEGLKLVSEIGIALLLFIVGLELSFSKIKDVGKVAIYAGLGQVLITSLGGFILCKFLNFTLIESVFLSVGLTFSSTVVVVKLLTEKAELDTLYGRIAVGIFLVQDLVAILVLTILAGLGSAGTELNYLSLSKSLATAFGGMILLLVVSLLASKYLFPKPFQWAAKRADMTLIWSLTWCFIMIYAAHELKLSLEAGAFLAGLSLAQLPHNEDLRRRIHPLMNFFIAIFFVTLGIKIDATGALANLWPTSILSLFVLIGNPLIFIGIIGFMGYGRKTSFLTSVTVAQISEFSFIFAGLGLSYGLIGTDILSIIMLVGLITIALSSYMILFSHQLYAWALRLGALNFRFLNTKASLKDHILHQTSSYHQHIIIVGMNTLGRDLVVRLNDRGETTLAIDTDPNKLNHLPGSTMVGSVDYLSVLEEAGYTKAKLIISALQIEETNDLLSYRAKSAHIPCAIHVVDLALVDNLLNLETDYLIVSKVDGIKAQLSKLKEMGVLP